MLRFAVDPMKGCDRPVRDAEQPQQEERLVRDAHLADAGLPEPGVWRHR